MTESVELGAWNLRHPFAHPDLTTEGHYADLNYCALAYPFYTVTMIDFIPHLPAIIPSAQMRLHTRSLFANFKQDLHGALLEFVGTFFFFTLAFGGTQATAAAGAVGPPAPNALNAFIVSLNFGFSLLVSAWCFYRVTGGLFNPNVSLALFLTGVIGPVRFVLYCIAQLSGSVAAAAVILALTPGPCNYK